MRPSLCFATAKEAAGVSGTMLQRSLVAGKVSDADKSYLALLVSQQSALPPSEAQKRVDDTLAEASRVTREAVDTARRGAILGRTRHRRLRRPGGERNGAESTATSPSIRDYLVLVPGQSRDRTDKAEQAMPRRSPVPRETQSRKVLSARDQEAVEEQVTRRAATGESERERADAPFADDKSLLGKPIPDRSVHTRGGGRP